MTRVTTPVAAVAVVAAASLANQAAGHMIQTYPYSRQYAHSAAVDVLPDGKEKPFSEGCAACYNSGGMGAKYHGGTGGVDFVIARGKRLTDPDVLDANGGGDVYPLPFGEYAENGNYLESDEIAKRHGICGDPSSGNDEDYSRYGIASSNFDVYHEYKAGESFHIDILLWAYHWGHMEFFICNTDELPEGADSVPTQECFNKFPLDRDPDYGSFSPIDPDYYGRYHLDPECTADETNIEVMNDWRGWIARMHYLIPADLECEHCVLQAVYRTGHRCRQPGYADFNPSGQFSTSECAPDKDSWINGGGSGVCGEPDTLYAEEFWACTDMRVIGSGGGDTVPVETPENTAAPTAEQTAKETAEEATMPPVSGFMCSGDMGILRGDICCSPECEACGGTGCRRDPGGGASSCCMGAIRVAGEYCSDTGAAPCIVDSTTAPDFTCSAEMGLLSDDICCPVSCGTCGGPGCRERGGGGACCTNAVRIEGELCSVKREAPCIMD